LLAVERIALLSHLIQPVILTLKTLVYVVDNSHIGRAIATNIGAVDA
jgi:hypothetical protein